jgi:quercetin dioxygenase-like cupin family protein
MSSLVKKNLNKPDEIKTPTMQKVESVTIDGMKIERNTVEPGWQWSKHVKPSSGEDSCQKHHFLFVLSGKLHVKMNDGKEEEFSAGEVGVIPPGHDGWNAGKEPLIWLEIPR